MAGRETAYNRLGKRQAQARDLAQMKKLALAHGNLTQQLETGNRQLKLATKQVLPGDIIAKVALIIIRFGQKETLKTCQVWSCNPKISIY